MGAKWLDTPLSRVLRKQGRRQAWLAHRLRIAPYTLSKIEAGRQRPPADLYARAALVLGVDEADIRPETAPEPVAA
jgi:transcriptional regulator with XRE-family HTH domain